MSQLEEPVSGRAGTGAQTAAPAEGPPHVVVEEAKLSPPIGNMSPKQGTGEF